ncbi:YdeI/OmpD-associated family protein [Portibacter lacus]|uniref:YdhG-like domain-containing protein n=1 Tax=Portibacter lacus TaxID=1099794 RepID=A0AA37SJM6_9BACT|nr:DUF1801 domain-containing protein [Portibacter lacus]GLR15938.1 hypothetical protein GCM10007940_05530 [Portibacter lacus]
MAAVKSVEEYIQRHTERKNELEKLRSLLLNLPFEESIKWGMPSYGFEGKNLVGIGSFKNWSCLWFHEGALLEDKSKVLENAQEGKTVGMRQWRFANLEEIDEPLVIAYLEETIEHKKSGKSITFKKKNKVPIEIPSLLSSHFDSHPDHLKTFENFTTSQKNEFSNYIIDAKREKTKLDRLEKIKVLLGEGKTLNTLWGGR